MKKPIEWLLLITLGVPMMVVGYLAFFLFNGFMSGYAMARAFHSNEDDMK